MRVENMPVLKCDVDLRTDCGQMIDESSKHNDAYKQGESIDIVVVVPLPLLPDDPEFAHVSQADDMLRFLDECEQVANANIGSLLLVNERSFPFSNHLSARDVAFVTKVLIELRRSIHGVRIGVDLVDDADATYAVATAAECNFARVRVAGPYTGLTTVVRPEHRRIRELIFRAADSLETWVALLPWGEKLSGVWTLSDLSAAVMESIEPNRVTVPIAVSNAVVDEIGGKKVVFDGGVNFDELSRGPGTYVMGSALRNGRVLSPLDVIALSRLSKLRSNEI